MPTLRSPKDFTGPDLDVPSLTYQSWHEAKFGRADWEGLGQIRGVMPGPIISSGSEAFYQFRSGTRRR